jgi:hypothetical protein
MAYSNQDDEEQQGQGLNQTLNQQGQPQPQTPEEPQASAPSSQPSTIGTSQPSQPAQPQQPKQQKAGTGTFTNLRNYLQANQGNRIASAAGQRVQNVAAGAQKGIQQANTAFGQKVEQGTLADRQKAVQDVTNIAQAGRQVQYQAPQAPAAPAPNTTQPAPTAPAAPEATPAEQAYFDAAQEKRFADIINAQYKGPQSLQQAGLYDTTAKKVATASQAAKNTQTALGREQLLRDMFSKNRDYSLGQSRLDSLLLNTSAPGVQQLQAAAKPASEVQAQLEQANTGSSNLAASRAREVQEIQNKAREAFTGQQTEQAKTVEDRITAMTTQPVMEPVLDAQGNPTVDANGQPAMRAVMKTDGTPMTEWDRLPEYFKSIIAKNKNRKLALGAEEAGVLGLSAGEGIFNLKQKLVKTKDADREALVSKDEVARQNALARLAGLDLSGALNKEQKYGIDKAGTQSSLSAIDTKGIRDQLNEVKKLFEKKAKAQNITGFGSKKNKTSGKRYYASETQNLGKLLKKAGYNFNAPESTQIGNTDILKNLSGDRIADQDPGTVLTSPGPIDLTSSISGTDNKGAIDPYTDNSSLASKLGYAAGDIASGGLHTVLRPAGIDVTGALMGGIDKFTGSSIFGGGSSSRESKSDAARMAREDLQRRVTAALNKSGVYNRANIVDNEKTRTRLEGLKALLASRDKTNA